MSLTRFVVASLVALAALGGAASASPPANFTNELLTSAVNEPIALAFLPNGRMLILEKGGRILISDSPSGPLAMSTYMTITNINTIMERGLLNIVLDPGFGVTNNYFYVYYHPDSPLRGRISRFTHIENSGGRTSRGSLASEFVVWQDTDGYTACCHYGGGLDFGPDGNLYLTIGEKYDGANAQNLAKAAGKIIRVAPNGTFPAGNYGMSDGPGGSIYDGIFAYGLRNPYRARWDLPTGRFFIGEVGGNDLDISTEDVHVATLSSSGTNFGWPFCEGACDNPDFPSCNCGQHDDPVFYYPHAGSGASITGGVVYRGGEFPASPYNGAYFYGDYVRGFIRYLKFDPTGTTVTGDFNFDSSAGIAIYIGEGPDGALYYTTYDGEVRRYVYDGGNQPPVITSAGAVPVLGPSPLEVTFTGAATDPEGDAMTYKWVFGDGDSATGNVVAGVVPAKMHTYGANGVYKPFLFVSDATNGPVSTPLEVRVGNPPSVTITSPPNLMTFQAGDTIFYGALATDPDETLDGSDYAWTARFKHNEHFHPGPFANAPGTGGFFVIESSGHDWNDDTGYVIDVLVTDSDGLTDGDTVEVVPEKVNLTFDTSPTGIPVTFDGIPRVTPFIYDTMIGFQHTVSVPVVPCVAGTSYAFTGWSDGGAATHVVTVPGVDSAYLASFTAGGTCGVPVESGLVMSLKGDLDVTTSGSTVTSWADQTASGNDLTNVLGAPTLLPAALNGHNVVAFDGVDDGMGRAGFSGLPTGAANRTILMVVRYDSDGWGGFTYGLAQCNRVFGLSVSNTATGGNLMVQGWCTANDFVSGTDGNGAGWMTQAVVLQSNAFTHYQNGVAIDSDTHTFNTGTTQIRLGVELDNTPFINMQVAEILVYNRALTALELQQVEDYFQAEYFAPPAPTIAITQPTDAQSIPGDSIVVAWTAGGDLSYAEHVHVQLDALPRVSIAQFNGTHVFHGVAPGPHVVRVELASESHAVLATDTVAVTVTGTLDPPAVENVVVSATSPANSPDDSITVAYDLLAPAVFGAPAWYRNDAPFAALYMPMEGNAVPALGDCSGNGFVATAVGAPAWSAGGGVGGSGAFAFGGSQSLILPDAPVFDVDHVSITAWIRIDAYVDDQRIVSKEFGTTEPYSIYTLDVGTTGTYTQGENRLDFRIGLEGQNRIRVVGTQTLPLGVWTHVAATFDGAAVRLYVNGQLDVSAVASGVLRKNNEAVYIGASQFYGQYFDGTIDDVHVYGRALAATQVHALYALGPGVIVPEETAFGEAWRACVTPFGAGAEGATVCSDTLVVGYSPPVAAGDTPSAPTRFALYQNVPNPFNPTTSISYDVPPGGARVQLDVYDVGGRLVARLVDGHEGPGHRSVVWNGLDRNGGSVASGVYFYRLQAPGFRQTRKMVLIQ